MLLRRRAFLIFLGCALASRPTRSVSQQEIVRTVGVLMGLSNDAESRSRAEAFEEGLKKEGWFRGQNLQVVYQFSDANSGRMEALARKIVALKPDCILGHSSPVMEALSKATRTLPIVFVSVTDPIGQKLVLSMARPGGNITGFTIFQGSMTGKYLTMLREMMPQLTRVAIVYNPESAPSEGTIFLPAFAEGAAEYKIEPITIQVHSAREIEREFEYLSKEDSSGLIVMPDNFLSFHRELIIALAARYRIPVIYPYRYFVEAGGLMSYGVDSLELFRQAAGYFSRILRGESPADLPVQSPTKFELVINLKTAKDLGLVVPDILIAGADKLIE